MFQKHSIMSLKKKSKSLGHLTALGSHPCSPDVEPKLKKNASQTRFQGLPTDSPHVPGQTAARYMKRLLSPSSQDRTPLPNKQPLLISSPMLLRPETETSDKQLQTRAKTTPKKLKGVMKGKGSAGAVAMGKALISNLTPSKGPGFSGRSGEGLADIFSGKDTGAFVPNKHRAFLMDTQVKYTIGLQSQERNLFLFNDLLLIAKERSSSHFKLKDQVPLSDVWLSTCIPDVSEVTLDTATSFVIGWPISNAVITFSCPEQKAVWWEKLCELIAIERSHSPAGASINITYFDNSTNFEHLKSIYVAISDCSRDCITKALECLELPGESSREPGDFQLWVRTKLDESPYPLIGHEIPLVIKLHWMRQTFNNKNQKTYDEYRQGCRCSFILRRVGQVSNFNGEVGSQKKKLKKVKSSMKLQNVFRRVSQVSRGATDTVDGEDSKVKTPGLLFGRALVELCGGDGQTDLPPPVCNMLSQLFQKGPETVGIFRRGPNVRMMRDLRERLDEGENIDWGEISVFVTAALLKDLLRSLPDCMLLCEDYTAWAESATSYQADRSIDNIKSLVDRLPPANHHLLRHILFILNKTASNNQENMMTASNLSICVGPSILWSSDAAYMMDQNYSKEVSALVQILVEDYEKLFGPETPALFLQQERGIEVGAVGGMVAERQNSVSSEKGGTKELRSRSSHFDHSSLDSLLDPAFPPEDDLARQSGTEGVSLTNLSHDSGLTTSDSQLYAFEEPENSFSSDDFCIETITSKDNTVHAIVNKKFLSRYQGAYQMQGNGQEFMQGQDHHHSSSQGREGREGRKKAGQRHQKHRDRMHRRIHRNSDYGAYPTQGSKPEVIEPAAYNYDVRTTKVNFPLRRTASEESVQHGSKFEIVHVNNNNRRKRPAAHRKGKAPNPPRSTGKTSPNIVRSNSVNQVRHWEQSMDWYRSKSTTRLGNSEDSEDSCSTLSDEDSTPHVSRSNSYGRSEDNTFNTTEEYSAGQDDTTYDIYLHDERTLEMSPQTNLETAFVQNAKRVQNSQGREFDSFSCETPPGYEESLYRQRLLKLHHRSSSYIAPSPVNLVPEKIIEKQVELSAKAKAVFEESLRQYETGGGLETPPPLPPKTERPPLPPKQRGRKSCGEQEQGSSDDQTYVNSAELRQTRSRTKLSVGAVQPRPHTADAQSGRKSSSEEKESSEFVYGSYFSGGGSTKVPVGGVREEVKEVKPVPSLPPKETRVAEVTMVETTRSGKKKSGVTSTRIVGTNVKPMKSVETQTDESDFYLLYPEGIPDEESFNNHTDSEYSPESNRSISPEFGGAAQYFRSPPEKAEYFLGTNTLFERPVSAQSVGLRQAGRRKLEPVQSVPTGHRNRNDPVIAGEINWSVSQLRTLFNQGLQQGAPNGDYEVQENLAGFRSPSRKQMLERRLNFHTGGGNYTALYGTVEPQTDSDQESYV